MREPDGRTQSPDLDRRIPAFLRDPAIAEILPVSGCFASNPRAGAALHATHWPDFRQATAVDVRATYMLVARHPSGALSFHDCQAPSLPTASTAHQLGPFNVPANIINGLADAIVVKLVDPIADTAIDLAEAAIWRALGQKPGLFQFIPKWPAGFCQKPAGRTLKAGPSGRALLFLHGTFSTTQGSFGALAEGSFFDHIRPLYGDAIYGFDHFSVSRCPAQNAVDLLACLPDDAPPFDVIAFSRGGLVLRHLAERSTSLAHGHRFKLGHAVLTATPNQGTPLATPGRWAETLGWITNILDLFPPNPITSNGAMLARWLTWFVKIGVKAADGLDAMNQQTALINPQPASLSLNARHYSALVSNFEPDRGLWARAADLGMDTFFNKPNDLVVPTAGGWQLNQSLDALPASQIGMFGPGGNIKSHQNPVPHTGFFGLPASQAFIIRALQRTAQTLPPLNPHQLRIPAV